MFALLVPILAGLYAMGVFTYYVPTAVYAQDQQVLMARDDGFEMVNIRAELRELKRERRDIKRILAYSPDDEDANDDMDEVQFTISELEARRCFLQSRNEKECRKDE